MREDGGPVVSNDRLTPSGRIGTAVSSFAGAGSSQAKSLSHRVKPTEHCHLIKGLPTLWAKRALDIMLSGLGLVLSAPLWAVISLAIKLEDGDGIVYGQERMGKGGQVFRVLKFRSMVRDAERETGAVWASENDARITRVGRFLRAIALDELPQLLNIVRGDMSFVGPRPERPELVARFREHISGYDSRFVVQPGLTGLAQIYGRYDSHPRDKLRYDLLYIRKRSFCLDLKLIVLSFWITLRGKWEYRGRKF